MYSDNLRITIVNRHREDTLGGSELQCDFIATELINRKYEVTYIAINGKDEPYRPNYEIVPCKNEGKDLILAIDSSKPDVVYWRFHMNHIYKVFRHLNSKGVKIIFAVSSEYDVHRFVYKKSSSLKSNIKRYIKKFNEFRGFRYVDAIVVNNQSHLDKLPVKKQKFIPNGMKRELKEFSWGKSYCAWIANIKDIKRPYLYINLSKEFAKQNIDFLMIGAIQEEDYSWMNDKNKLPSNLHYLGPKSLEEVNGILKNSLFHIHTCFAEGFPNVFIQAWMQGKPSVSFGFDPSDYIKKHEMGYCSDESWSTFVNQVSELLVNEDLRNNLGNNAKEFADKMFRIEQSVSMLEDIINDLN